MKYFSFLLLLVVVGQAEVGHAPKAEGRCRSDGASAAEQTGGLDSTVLMAMQTDIDNGIYPNIHSVLIARGGGILYEHYWPGKDQRLGFDLGVAVHGRDSLHDMRSCTKSWVSVCIGIAIAQGKIKSLETPVFSFFPEYAAQDTGMKASLTVRDLLTMSSGLDWDESVPYNDPKNSEIKMDFAKDPIGYVLSQPMAHPRGTVWNYNGGTTQVLAAIIQKVSGKPIDEFAREYLFGPLGIDNYQWLKMFTAKDMPSAAAGLRLRSRDLLKLGLLYQQEGKWEGRQIVPAWWVDSSLQSHILRNPQTGQGGYGFQFWVFDYTLKDEVTELPTGVGNGDQRLYIDRKHDLVVVVTAGNYNNWRIPKNANALMGDYIYPAAGMSK
jgi:CubicO group peptidase (beta-lactamase class C family)